MLLRGRYAPLLSYAKLALATGGDGAPRKPPPSPKLPPTDPYCDCGLYTLLRSATYTAAGAPRPTQLPLARSNCARDPRAVLRSGEYATLGAPRGKSPQVPLPRPSCERWPNALLRYPRSGSYAGPCARGSEIPLFRTAGRCQRGDKLWEVESGDALFMLASELRFRMSLRRRCQRMIPYPMRNKATMAPMTPPTTARELTLPPAAADAVRPLFVPPFMVGMSMVGAGVGLLGAVTVTVRGASVLFVLVLFAGIELFFNPVAVVLACVVVVAVLDVLVLEVLEVIEAAFVDATVNEAPALVVGRPVVMVVVGLG